MQWTSFFNGGVSLSFPSPLSVKRDEAQFKKTKKIWQGKSVLVHFLGRRCKVLSKRVKKKKKNSYPFFHESDTPGRRINGYPFATLSKTIQSKSNPNQTWFNSEPNSFAFLSVSQCHMKGVMVVLCTGASLSACAGIRFHVNRVNIIWSSHLGCYHKK